MTGPPNGIYIPLLWIGAAFLCMLGLAILRARSIRSWLRLLLTTSVCLLALVLLQLLPPGDEPENLTSLEESEVPVADAGDVLIGLAVSGGGSRAAYFGAALLDELNRYQLSDSKAGNDNHTVLGDELDIVAGTSGGALTVASISAKRSGRGLLDLPGIRLALRTPFRTRALIDRVSVGALRYPFTGCDLGCAIERQFNRVLDFGLELRELSGSPMLVVTASDLNTGEPAYFTQSGIFFPHSSRAEANVTLARACRVSSTVPGLLRSVRYQYEGPPYTLRGGFLAGTPYQLRLVDGGLVDNLGVRALLKGVGDINGRRRGETHIYRGVLFLVVDASSFHAEEERRIRHPAYEHLPKSLDLVDRGGGRLQELLDGFEILFRRAQIGFVERVLGDMEPLLRVYLKRPEARTGLSIKEIRDLKKLPVIEAMSRLSRLLYPRVEERSEVTQAVASYPKLYDVSGPIPDQVIELRSYSKPVMALISLQGAGIIYSRFPTLFQNGHKDDYFERRLADLKVQVGLLEWTPSKQEETLKQREAFLLQEVLAKNGKANPFDLDDLQAISRSLRQSQEVRELWFGGLLGECTSRIGTDYDLTSSEVACLDLAALLWARIYGPAIQSWYQKVSSAQPHRR